MQIWTEQFQGTRSLSTELQQDIARNSEVLNFKKGDLLFSADQSQDRLLFLIEGQLRVQQINAAGREIVLFRAVAGENCVMSTAGLISDAAMAADGIAETDVKAAAMSQGAFDALMGRSAEFRRFVIAAYNKRIRDLFLVVDEVAFGRMDIRLASKLLQLGGDQGRVEATHQNLAIELGTAREVISRQLHEFQRKGLIAQSRGKIEILDGKGLLKLSENA